MAEAQLLPDPFHSRPWPEDDVQFVIEAVTVWRQRPPWYAEIQRKVLKQVTKALAPLEASLDCSSRRVASEKRPGFAAFLTVLLRWPDWDQPLNFLQGYDIVGTVEMLVFFVQQLSLRRPILTSG